MWKSTAICLVGVSVLMIVSAALNPDVITGFAAGALSGLAVAACLNWSLEAARVRDEWTPHS